MGRSSCTATNAVLWPTSLQRSEVEERFGLAIARGIVVAHAGHIFVVNMDGGCQFVVVLPLADV